MAIKSKIILGIDPGLVNTGWGVIEKSGNQLRYIANGTIKPSTKDEMHHRLQDIFEKISNVIDEYKPDTVGIEESFVNSNPQTSLKLGMAVSASMLACSNKGLEVFSYSATKVKKSTVGVGRADKHQVFSMLKILLSGLNDTGEIHSEHSADAIAIAITHANHF